MQTFLKFIFTSIAICAIGLVFMVLAQKGLEGQEQFECKQWAQQAVDFKDKGFYLTKWQKEQCLHYNIIIDNVSTTD